MYIQLLLGGEFYKCQLDIVGGVIQFYILGDFLSTRSIIYLGMLQSPATLRNCLFFLLYLSFFASCILNPCCYGHLYLGLLCLLSELFIIMLYHSSFLVIFFVSKFTQTDTATTEFFCLLFAWYTFSRCLLLTCLCPYIYIECLQTA